MVRIQIASISLSSDRDIALRRDRERDAYGYAMQSHVAQATREEREATTYRSSSNFSKVTIIACNILSVLRYTVPSSADT